MKSFKTWNDFSKEELVKIAKMLSQNAYGDISLNMNDIFAPAAWGVDCDQFDLVAVSELYEEFGDDGVIAWCAVKEDVDKIFKGQFPKFNEAKNKIKNNLPYYFWEKRYALKKGDLK